MLSLSVREAIEQTLVSLRHGRQASGVDTALQGGQSTDGKKIASFIVGFIFKLML